MGAVYSVFMKMSPKQGKTEEDIAAAIEEFIRDANGKKAHFHDEDVRALNGSLAPAVAAILPNVERFEDEWEADFDCCYSWQIVICDCFDKIAPFLTPGSEITICPDHDYCLGTVTEEGTVNWHGEMDKWF